VGASFAGYTALRLPFAVKSLFEQWLERHYPERKDKVLNRIRAMRGGKLNDANFKTRMRGEGIYAEEMAKLFEFACRKAGINKRWPGLSTKYFRKPPTTPQLNLFDDPPSLR
jgi:DNA repair photolyase